MISVKYIGLDLHKESISICVRNRDLRRVKADFPSSPSSRY